MLHGAKAIFDLVFWPVNRLIDWLSGPESETTTVLDPIDVPGRPDCLDVKGYSIYVLYEKEIDPYIQDNYDAMSELSIKLNEIVDMYSGAEINSNLKHDVKGTINRLIEHMESEGKFKYGKHIVGKFSP